MKRLENHDSPARIQEFLRESGLAPSRRFGQNFLVNPNIRARIVKNLELEPSHHVWEVGPGLGAMSEALAGLCGELSLFEIDRRFAAYLRELFIERDEVELVEGDFLKTWRDRAQERGFPDRVLGNLPYNAASQIIATLLEGGVKARMVFTVQKEVGQRMMAQPGGKEYSSLSVLCALYSSVVDGGDVAAGSFFPAPHVVSKVVIVEPHERFEASLRERASQIARDAFAARRKTLRNALKSGSLVRIYDPAKIIAAIEAAGIDPSLRGESLGVDQYVEIANKLSSSSSEI